MTTWQVAKTLLKEIGIYRRRIIYFGLFFVVALVVYLAWQNLGSTQAAILETVPPDALLGQENINIQVQKNGTVLIDNKKNNQALKFYQEYDELRVLIADQPSTFIPAVKVTVHLPEATNATETRQIIYAVHGVNETDAYMTDPQTLVYEALEISPTATLTIVADFPKGMILPNFWQRVGILFANLPVKSWLYVAIVIPSVIFLVMLFMIIKRHQAQIIRLHGSLGGPPEILPPAIPGVLIDGVVGAREIAATLIDLARRGYIYIINKGKGQFSFGMRQGGDIQTLPGLSAYERELLSKIFLPSAYKSTVGDVQMRIGRHIFSKKIANFYLGIYNEATKRGFFVENPAKVHLAWKNTGVVLFFLSFIGFMAGAITGADPKYGVFFWIGGMITSAVIIRLAPFMPARTSKGDHRLQEWLEFRRYLTDHKPATGPMQTKGRFEDFLPYAIVLGAEVDWAKRFGSLQFNKPDWYETDENVVTLDSFASELYPLIGFVAENLARSHEPTVE